MVLFITHRRLKPGGYDAFRAAWDPGEDREQLEQLGFRQRIYHARSIQDPDEVISFGLFDIDASDLDRVRAQLGGEDAERERQARIAEHVESSTLDGVFEVVETLSIGDAGDAPDGVVFLTHRRLKPGGYDGFRAAWLPEGALERLESAGMMETAYHARSLKDPDEIVSFGIAGLSVEQLARFRDELAGEEGDRQAGMAEFVEWTGVDATFEVVELIAVDPAAT